MSILIIGLAMLITHVLGMHWRRPRQRLVNLWFSSVAHYFGRGGAARAILGLVVTIGLPAAIVGLAQWTLAREGALLWFGFSLLALLFAWGPRDLDRDVRRYLEADNDDERQIHAEALTYSYRDPSRNTHRAGVIKGVFYQSLVRWFGVIFWFLLLGAAGAIAFRLAHATLSEPRNRALLSEVQIATARGLITVIDLLPAALTTFALAIVGDFDTVVGAWRRQIFGASGRIRDWDREFLPEVGFRTVMHGDEVEQAFSHDFEGALAKVNQAMSLVWRALVCWLTVIALLILAGWVS
jgi:AmpE protein